MIRQKPETLNIMFKENGTTWNTKQLHFSQKVRLAGKPLPK